MIHEYLNHPEAKFANGNSTGKLRRRHMFIENIKYIGKEANKLEENELGLDEEPYVEYSATVTRSNEAVYSR